MASLQQFPFPAAQITYLAHHGGEAYGPFPLEFIEAMVMAEVFSPDTLLQPAHENRQIPFRELKRSSPTASLPDLPGHLSVAHLAMPPEMVARQEAAARRMKKLLPIALVVTVFGFGVPLLVHFISSGAGGSTDLLPKYEVPRNLPAAFKGYGAAKSEAPAPSESIPLSPLPQSVVDVVRGKGQVPAREPKTPVGYSQKVLEDEIIIPGQPPAQTPSTGTSPSSGQAESGTATFTDASGHTYSLSKINYDYMLGRKAELEKALTKVNQIIAKRDALVANLEQKWKILDNRQPAAVQRFNQEVAYAEKLGAEIQQERTAYNQLVDRFNADLARLGIPVR